MANAKSKQEMHRHLHLSWLFLLTLHYVKDRAAKIQQKFLPLSVYVHFCPFLSVYVGKIFGNLKKNPYLCTVKQHNDDNGTAPSSRIHFAFKDKPFEPLEPFELLKHL